MESDWERIKMDGVDVKISSTLSFFLIQTSSSMLDFSMFKKWRSNKIRYDKIIELHRLEIVHIQSYLKEP